MNPRIEHSCGLEKLLVRGGNFTDNGLATATMHLYSLRYIWAHGYRGHGDATDATVELRPQQRLVIPGLLTMNRPYWIIEQILGEKFDEHGVLDDQRNPSHFLAYYSVAGHIKRFD